MRKRIESVTFRELEGEVLVLDAEANLIHKLNPTASFVWRHLEEARSPDKLAGLLAQSFDVNEHTALRDVIDVLKQFRILNLVLEG
jgi:hypothetical protein